MRQTSRRLEDVTSFQRHTRWTSVSRVEHSKVVKAALEAATEEKNENVLQPALGAWQ